MSGVTDFLTSNWEEATGAVMGAAANKMMGGSLVKGGLVGAAAAYFGKGYLTGEKSLTEDLSGLSAMADGAFTKAPIVSSVFSVLAGSLAGGMFGQNQLGFIIGVLFAVYKLTDGFTKTPDFSQNASDISVGTPGLAVASAAPAPRAALPAPALAY